MMTEEMFYAQCSILIRERKTAGYSSDFLFELQLRFFMLFCAQIPLLAACSLQPVASLQLCFLSFFQHGMA
jgi:hypothetical protein